MGQVIVCIDGLDSMRNSKNWKPSKFVFNNGRLMASANTREVNVASRMVTAIIGNFYLKAIKEHAKGRLLDLGCGKAPLYHVYREYANEVICVDWSNSIHDNEYIDVACDLTQNIPFADGQFDTILMSDVLEHIPNPDRLLREVSRVLSDDGKLLLNVPFYYWIHEGPHDYYRYTEYALIHLVENCGLKIIHLSPYGGSPEVFADFSAKNLKFIPGIGPIMSLLVQKCIELFVRTSLGRKVSTRTSRIFPLGYSLIAEKPQNPESAL